MHKIILLLAVVSSSAMAEWIKYDSSDKGTSYFNPSTIRKKGHIVKMWELNNYSSSGDSAKRQMEFDCNKEAARQIAVIFYNKPMGAGDVTVMGNETFDWFPIVPDSTLEIMFQSACGKK